MSSMSSATLLYVRRLGKGLRLFPEASLLLYVPWAHKPSISDLLMNVRYMSASSASCGLCGLTCSKFHPTRHGVGGKAGGCAHYRL
jgi:hypothetical protein